MADEETLFVVVGIDEPAGDAFSPVAAHLAGIGVKDVDTVDLYLDLAVFGVENVDVGLAEDDKQIPLAGVFQVVGHVQVGVHPRLEHGDAAEFVEVGRVRIVVEGAGDKDVKVGVTRLASGGDQVRARNGAELRADEDRSTLWGRVNSEK